MQKSNAYVAGVTRRGGGVTRRGGGAAAVTQAAGQLTAVLGVRGARSPRLWYELKVIHRERINPYLHKTCFLTLCTAFGFPYTTGIACLARNFSGVRKAKHCAREGEIFFFYRK